MKKTRLLWSAVLTVILCVCACVGILAGCSSAKIESVKITNKEALTAEWTVGGTIRKIELSFEPESFNANNVEYAVTSSDESVVAADGLELKAVSAGTATITVTAEGKSDSVDITVKKLRPDLESITIANKEELAAEWALGSPDRKIELTFAPAEYYSVENTNVEIELSKPTVKANGFTLQALGVGTTVLTVSVGDIKDTVEITTSVFTNTIGGTVKGVVGTSEAQNLSAGTTLTFTGIETKTVQVEADGTYSISLPAGEYKVSAEGYDKATLTVSADNSAANIQLRYKLLADSAYSTVEVDENGFYSMVSLLDALQTENETLFDVTLTVTAYNYTGNDNYKKNTRRAMLTGNFRPSTLYGLQIEGFKSAAVSPVSTLKSQERGINSSSLAAAFPFVRTFVMDDGGILLGENNKSGFPFIFNIWKRGNLYQNSNAFIIGKSGSGKSYFLKNLILNEWSNGTRVIMLDPEAEYLALTRNLYGNVINVGNAREGRLNPFHIYKILTEDGSVADSKVTFNTHLKMLESFYKIVLADAPLDVIELINNLTVETYERMGITEDTDCSDFPADYFPLFSDLLETLQSKDKSQMDALTLRDMRTAELYLQKFVNGRYSDIWNAPSTLQVSANLIDFDFQSLFANKNNVVANAQMLLVFRFIEQEVINARERNKNGANLRTLIIADEAHLYIDPKFPIALDFFYSMSKRIRKYNGSFIPATQNIADWNANEELRGKTSAIIKNSQYTFIFKLSAPDMKDVLDVYKAGDSFNDEEQRMIISAVTGQAFFVGSTELRACVRIQAEKNAEELFKEEKCEEDH